MLEKEAPEPFAIAILDMHMPGLDGLELGKYIRETPTYAGMPLLLLSSGNSVNSPEQKNIFDGILQKPARTADLLHFVHKLAVAETTERKPAIALPTTGEIDLSAFSILLVEDNMINQRVAQKMLDRFQVQAEIANNGLEALQFVKLMQFDLILMDMQMPVMDGLEATRAIRGLAHTQQPRILAMTANASRTDQQACMAAGMDDFLTKPIRLEVLRDSLVRWLLNPKVNAPTKLPG